MKFLAVIPARSGSETIKKKNLHLINKKPLVQYTFEELKKSKLKQNYLLSDDLRIIKLAKKFNICTDYKRPKNLSKNTTSLVDVLHHFHKWIVKKKIFYDYILVLQPTSPLRNCVDIKSAVQMVKRKKFRSLFSISSSLEHPYESLIITKNKKWKHILDKAKLYYRRQDFDIKSFFINGAIYIIHRKLVEQRKIYDMKNHGLYEMPKYRSMEINDLEEAKMVAALIKNL